MPNCPFSFRKSDIIENQICSKSRTSHANPGRQQFATRFGAQARWRESGRAARFPCQLCDVIAVSPSGFLPTSLPVPRLYLFARTLRGEQLILAKTTDRANGAKASEIFYLCCDRDDRLPSLPCCFLLLLTFAERSLPRIH